MNKITSFFGPLMFYDTLWEKSAKKYFCRFFPTMYRKISSDQKKKLFNLLSSPENFKQSCLTSNDKKVKKKNHGTVSNWLA